VTLQVGRSSERSTCLTKLTAARSSSIVDAAVIWVKVKKLK
jgi:hypothetical protein